MKYYPAGRVSPGAAVTHLINSTGGTGSDTVGAIADVAVDIVDAAKRADVNLRIDVIRNNFSDLIDKVNTILTRLESAEIIDT